jgi:FkbM family methyltransferase
MAASEEQPQLNLTTLQRELLDQRDRLAATRRALEETLTTIERSRGDVDTILDDMPERQERMRERLILPDVAAAPLREAASWEPVEVTLDEGIRFSVLLDREINDPVTAGLATGRASDQNLLSLMLQLVGPGDVVLDLGAHVGAFALAASAAGCGVVAVEASPDNAALLRLSAARNGFHDLRIVNAVVAAASGQVAFQPNGPWGHVAWQADDDEDNATSVSMPAVAVDDLVRAFALQRVAFVKMDVEGSEPEALAGMAGLLGRSDAPPVLFESNGHALAFASATPNDLLARLESFGYLCYQVDAHRLTRLDAASIQVETVAECLAVKGRPALSGWEVRPSMTLEDRLLRIVAESRHPNPDCRAYVARTLALVEEDLRTHPMVATALDCLRTDAVAEVRDAAAWSGEPQAAERAS